MKWNNKYGIWLLLTLACCRSLCAQQTGNEEYSAPPPSNKTSSEQSVIPAGETPFIVRTIVIEGNKKTHPSIILRELGFKSGDRFLLQDLVRKFEKAREQLMNTTLFHEAMVALKSFEGYNVDILISVRERWYIFPVPYIKPVDRNLNQWLVEQKASLNRVDYGVKLLWNNFTGRNDKFRFTWITGYNRQLVLTYDRPYIDKSMKWGMSFGFQLGRNQEINYNTIGNKQVFVKDEGYMRNFWRGSLEATYRKAIKTRHRFGVAHTTEEVADTVVHMNPLYFTGGRTRISFPEFYYVMTYYDVDYIPYPTKGYAAEVMFSKKGVDKSMNSWQLSVKGSANWPTSKKTFFSLNGYGTVKLPFDQPYYNRRLLGYSDIFMNGYEYYVVDGVAGGYLKAAFTRKLFKFGITLPGTKKIAPLKVPFNIYGRVFGNTGYVYDPEPGENNTLANRPLFSYGVGIDITTIYDFTFKLDFSFNQLGQNGLFFHRRNGFQ